MTPSEKVFFLALFCVFAFEIINSQPLSKRMITEEDETGDDEEPGYNYEWFKYPFQWMSPFNYKRNTYSYGRNVKPKEVKEKPMIRIMR